MTVKIGIDFDGTIIKEPKSHPSFQYTFNEHAENTIRRLAADGHKLFLHSARTGWYRIPMIMFIIKNNLPISWTWLNQKPGCHVYIDNNNLDCECIDWLKIYEKISVKYTQKQ